MAKKKKLLEPKEAESLSFDYIKSNHFRVVHMNGAFGGLSPNGAEIHMAVFNERRPIPRKTVHEVVDGRLGKEDASKRVSRDAFVREIEIDIVMDLDAAISLRKWLDDKINQLSQNQAEAIQKIVAEQGKQKTNGSKAKE